MPMNRSDVRPRGKKHCGEKDGGINRIINNYDAEQSRIFPNLSDFSEERPLTT